MGYFSQFNPKNDPTNKIKVIILINKDVSKRYFCYNKKVDIKWEFINLKD
jgi:hypothetical protein